jgi:hypothetical protein
LADKAAGKPELRVLTSEEPLREAILGGTAHDGHFPELARLRDLLCRNSSEFERGAIVAVTEIDSDRATIAGFAFVERHSEQPWAVIRDLAVEADHQSAELARCLIDRALEWICDRPKATPRVVFGVCAAAEPSNVPGVPRGPRDDLRKALEAVGGQRVPTDDLRGALETGLDAAETLVAVPLDCKPTVALGDIAGALATKERSGHSRDDPIDLVPNAPSLTFERFGVVLHFVELLDPVAAEDAINPKTPDDRNELNPFASFEDDLLSYQHLARHWKSRFWSKAFPLEENLRSATLKIRVPLEFESEGARRKLYFPPPLVRDGTLRERVVAVRASRTVFTSGLRICHLALVDDPGETGSVLDEFDVVALTKLWQTSEGTERLREQDVRLHTQDGPTDGWPIEQFATEVFGWHSSSESEAAENRATKREGLVGTVQLITDPSNKATSAGGDRVFDRQAVPWDVTWKALLALIEPDKYDDEGEEVEKLTLTRDHPYKCKTDRGLQITALAGAVQGILDFQAIDDTELADVFAEREIDEERFLGIHKGTLLSVMASDRSYDVVASKIGVSPYLLLPQAVLLHNDALLHWVWKLGDDLDRAEDRSFKRCRNPEKLQRTFDTMREKLAFFVPNVFQYPTEQALYRTGEATRGLAELRRELENKATTIEKRWAEAVELRRRRADIGRNLLLAAIGLISTFQVVHHIWYRVLVGAVVASAALLLVLFEWIARHRKDGRGVLMSWISRRARLRFRTLRPTPDRSHPVG